MSFTKPGSCMSCHSSSDVMLEHHYCCLLAPRLLLAYMYATRDIHQARVSLVMSQQFRCYAGVTKLNQKVIATLWQDEHECNVRPINCIVKKDTYRFLSFH